MTVVSFVEADKALRVQKVPAVLSAKLLINRSQPPGFLRTAAAHGGVKLNGLVKMRRGNDKDIGPLFRPRIGHGGGEAELFKAKANALGAHAVALLHVVCAKHHYKKSNAAVGHQLSLYMVEAGDIGPEGIGKGGGAPVQAVFQHQIILSQCLLEKADWQQRQTDPHGGTSHRAGQD